MSNRSEPQEKWDRIVAAAKAAQDDASATGDATETTLPPQEFSATLFGRVRAFHASLAAWQRWSLIAGLISILLFVASFAVSLGPVMWVMLPEIFPNKVRGVGMALTGVVNSTVSFGVQFLFPWQLTNLGVAATFTGYALFAILGFALVLWLVPETRGKTLEELEIELTARARA